MAGLNEHQNDGGFTKKQEQKQVIKVQCKIRKMDGLTHDTRETLKCPWDTNIWLNLNKFTILSLHIHTSQPPSFINWAI